ncbi:MAG: endonuclease/exonuclease/phosphatase family protein [Flammeovirgaceae bacterium]
MKRNIATLRNLFSFLILTVVLGACQEDIADIPPQTPGGGGSGGSTGNDPGHIIDAQYQSCFNVLDTNTLDIVTWNIENFPMEGANSIDLAAEVVRNMYPDVIAIQELRSQSDFLALASRLQGYEAAFHNVHLGQDLGFLYKTSEIVQVSETSTIYDDDRDAFPRQPVLMTVTHKSGLEVTLINIHLKCCSDGRDRRAAASVLLKSYIDTNLPNDNVVLLGDYNDEIFESDDVFANFSNDSFNYKFVDEDIARGNSSNWSYPSWPSHLDHILITNELFDRVVDTQVLKVNVCNSSYPTILSDHRPVMVRLNAE